MKTDGATGITMRTGDVLLLERPATPGGWLSHFIRRGTNSPYSHSVVVLDADRVAQSRPGENGGGDVQIFDQDGLTDVVIAPLIRIDLFRAKHPTADAALLDDAVTEFSRRATPPVTGGEAEVNFYLGGVMLLAALQQVQRHCRLRGPECEIGGHDVRRLERALFWAVENGKELLFCSEFAHRVLDSAGQRPVLPDTPALSTGPFPTDEPVVMHFDIDFMRIPMWSRITAWITDIGRELAEKIFHDENAFELFPHAWRDVIYAYERELSPSQLTIADFFTPADFSRSPSFTRIARRTPNDGEWFSIPPMPTDGSWP